MTEPEALARLRREVEAQGKTWRASAQLKQV